MNIRDAYQNLTAEAQDKARTAIAAQLEAAGSAQNPEYIKQVLLGIRHSPCGEEVARVISGYFRGYIGIDVSPEEVMAGKNGRG
jgi:hypothetical protein